MSFAAQIGSFCKNTQDKLQRIRRGIIIKLFSAVILDTPVDTGRLRGNWQLKEGDPEQSTRELLDPSGAVAISEMTEGVNKSKAEEVMYLSNNLPYAARVEFDGWSHTKAPEGMVRKNIARFNQIIQIEGSAA